MQISKKYFSILLLFVSPSLLFSGGASKHRAGVEITADSNTTASDTVVTINNDNATFTYSIIGKKDNDERWKIEEGGAFFLGNYTETERDSLTASAGAILWDSTNSGFYGYDGSTWSVLGSGGGLTTATDTITASPTLNSTDGYISITNPTDNDFNLDLEEGLPVFNANKVQGTDWNNASPTIQQLFFYSATQTAILPLRIASGSNISMTWSEDSSSGTLEISAASGRVSTYTLTFQTMFEDPDNTASGTSKFYQSTYLSNTGNQSIQFGNAQIPLEGWNESTDISFSFPIFTPDNPASSDIVLQLQGQIITPGGEPWATNGYTIFGSDTISLASQTTIQVIEPSFSIPAASATAGDYIFLKVKRIKSDASDTHSDNIHFYGAAALISQEQ